MGFRFSHSRPLSYFILFVALSMFPLVASATQYQPGQTLNPSCPPTDPTCVVIPSTISSSFQATSTTATSTFAGSVSVASTASSTNVVVSNSLVIGTLNGILKAVAGVVTSALVNLSSDVTGVLNIANGGTGTSTAPAYGQFLIGDGSGNYALMGTSSLGIVTSQWTTSGGTIYYNTGNVGLGTSSPFAKLSINANNGDTNTMLFAIGSSTQSATSTLFSINNAGQVVIGGTASSTIGQLSVMAGTSTATRISQSTLANAAVGQYLQGRYLYVVENNTTNGFEIWDISNPAAPLLVSQSTLGAVGRAINVQGHYAFVTVAAATNGFEVWDVSNPAAPVRISRSNVINAIYSMYVQGRYAYLADQTSNLEIFDVSNPGAPVRVGNLALGGTAEGVFVQGPYAYVAEGFSSLLEIWNVSNPASAYRLSQSALSQTGQGIYVQGRYAYLNDLTNSNSFEIWDVSNPSSPTRVALTAPQGSGRGIYAQGRYAYTVSTTFLETWDVSNPTAPIRVSKNSLTNAGNRGVVVQGRYAYVTENGTTNGIEIFDLGGAYIQQGEFGGLETGTLSVRDNLQAVDGSFAGGLSVGSSLSVTGSGSFLAASSTYNTTANIFSVATASSTGPILSILGNDNVGIGTSTPYSNLSVWGPDTASSTLAFNIVNNASTTVFAVFDGGNAQLSGTLTQSSDKRLKTNINTLDASSSLAAINQLTPVTYNWLDPDKGGTKQYGFIAQQVQQVFPNLVSTTSATALTPDGTLGLNYLGLIAPLVEAVQTLSAELQKLTATVQSFAHSFASDSITANNQLCVKNSSGTPVCITGDQLSNILSGTPLVQLSAPTPPTISETTTPPITPVVAPDATTTASSTTP